MTLQDAIKMLVLGHGREYPVLDTGGLRMLFPDDGDAAFKRGVRKLVAVGLLERVASGRYLNLAHPKAGVMRAGRMARCLRPRHLCYLSYESALAQHGSMDQLPMCYTIATTGRHGRHVTRSGTLDFTHTNRSDVEILRGTLLDEDLDMLVAAPDVAAEDLRRARPAMLHLIDDEAHADAIADWGRMSAPRAGGTAHA